MILNMPNPTTTITLTVLALLSLMATFLAFVRLRRPQGSGRIRRLQYSLTGLCLAGAVLLMGYRAVFVTHGWRPLSAHLEGLLLIAALFAAGFLFVRRGGIKGLSVFALPIFTLILAWAICASRWTYEPFTAQSMWRIAHLAGVYLGTLFFCLAAVSGGMYLYVHRRLRKRRDPTATPAMASLEAIESLNIRSATVGFALLTLGMVTGLIIVTAQDRTKLGVGWWYSPKIVLSAVAWLSYALVMNVRFATAFRGRRAAWLSIAGLTLLLAVFGVVQSLPDLPRSQEDQMVWRPPGAMLAQRPVVSPAANRGMHR